MHSTTHLIPYLLAISSLTSALPAAVPRAFGYNDTAEARQILAPSTGALLDRRSDQPPSNLSTEAPLPPLQFPKSPGFDQTLVSVSQLAPEPTSVAGTPIPISQPAPKPSSIAPVSIPALLPFSEAPPPASAVGPNPSIWAPIPEATLLPELVGRQAADSIANTAGPGSLSSLGTGLKPPPASGPASGITPTPEEPDWASSSPLEAPQPPAESKAPAPQPPSGSQAPSPLAPLVTQAVAPINQPQGSQGPSPLAPLATQAVAPINQPQGSQAPSLQPPVESQASTPQPATESPALAPQPPAQSQAPEQPSAPDGAGPFDGPPRPLPTNWA